MAAYETRRAVPLFAADYWICHAKYRLPVLRLDRLSPVSFAGLTKYSRSYQGECT